MAAMTGDEIRAVRVKLNESQTAFARRLEVDQSTLSRWERYGLPDRWPPAAREAIENVMREAAQ